MIYIPTQCQNNYPNLRSVYNVYHAFLKFNVIFAFTFSRTQCIRIIDIYVYMVLCRIPNVHHRFLKFNVLFSRTQCIRIIDIYVYMVCTMPYPQLPSCRMPNYRPSTWESGISRRAVYIDVQHVHAFKKANTPLNVLSWDLFSKYVEEKHTLSYLLWCKFL
jgi:hypothetical protein